MSEDYARPRPRSIPPAVALPLLRDRLERLRGELGPVPTFAGTQHVGILLGIVRDALDVLDVLAAPSMPAELRESIERNGERHAAETRRLAAVRRAQRQAGAPPAGASPAPVETVAVSPGDVAGIPWRDGCAACAGLRDEAEPGLYTWIYYVGAHFETAHRVMLVGP